MRNFLLILLCFLCVANSYGQTATSSYGRVDVEITKEKTQKIYTKVDIKSTFPGGDSSWARSLEKKLDQTIKLDRRVKKGKYVVSVQFVVAKDGSLSDIKCLNDPGFGMGAAVLREIKKGPTWGPCDPPCEVKPYRRSAITYQDE